MSGLANDFLDRLAAMPLAERLAWVERFNALTADEAIALAKTPLDAPKAECLHSWDTFSGKCIKCNQYRVYSTPKAEERPGPEKKARRMRPNFTDEAEWIVTVTHAREHDELESCKFLDCQPVEAAPVEPEPNKDCTVCNGLGFVRSSQEED